MTKNNFQPIRITWLKNFKNFLNLVLTGCKISGQILSKVDKYSQLFKLMLDPGHIEKIIQRLPFFKKEKKTCQIIVLNCIYCIVHQTWLKCAG